jgi:NAD(P)-dependent dehydrogenase (short-subunit alcohol dehydrogenase family)
MARIFITGSSTGLGQLAAELLISQGHQVVLHARNQEREKDAWKSVRRAEVVLTGDLASIEQTTQLASDVNALGRFDAVIHNAGINHGSGKDILTVNTLAPYILTCLIRKPDRLIYIGSDMHIHGRPSLANVASGRVKVSYSDSKLYLIWLMKAVARKWPEVYTNAVDPGWVPTRMGGRAAPDNLEQGFETQAWLAVSNDDTAKVSGRNFVHKHEADVHPEADNIALQEGFLSVCEQITGVRLSHGTG